VPTLGHLINDRRDLQLKVKAGGRAELADIEVSGLVVLEDQDPAKRSRHQAHPPGTLFLIDLGGSDVGGTASVVGRLVITLAERRASGLVVAVREHGPRRPSRRPHSRPPPACGLRC
jgi:hypothetical protein